MEKGADKPDKKDGRGGELELLSDDTAWKKLAGVQLLLLAVVGIWAMADRKPEIMLFSLIPLAAFFIYAARTRGGAKRLGFGPSSVRFEKLSGKSGEIQREMVEKVEVKRSAAMTSVTVRYRRGREGGRLALKTTGDLGAGVAEGLREMGYGVAGE
jgi:hypothetical protein